MPQYQVKPTCTSASRPLLLACVVKCIIWNHTCFLISLSLSLCVYLCDSKQIWSLWGRWCWHWPATLWLAFRERTCRKPWSLCPSTTHPTSRTSSCAKALYHVAPHTLLPWTNIFNFRYYQKGCGFNVYVCESMCNIEWNVCVFLDSGPPGTCLRSKVACVASMTSCPWSEPGFTLNWMLHRWGMTSLRKIWPRYQEKEPFIRVKNFFPV